jgi:hypothetical protein
MACFAASIRAVARADAAVVGMVAGAADAGAPGEGVDPVAAQRPVGAKNAASARQVMAAKFSARDAKGFMGVSWASAASQRHAHVAASSSKNKTRPQGAQ